MQYMRIFVLWSSLHRSFECRLKLLSFDVLSHIGEKTSSRIEWGIHAEHTVECVAVKAIRDQGFLPFHSDIESILLAIRCLARRCVLEMSFDNHLEQNFTVLRVECAEP